MEKLRVKVKRVLWPKTPQENNAWKLLLTDMGKAAGKVAWEINPGDELWLNGDWEFRNCERQFSFTTAQAYIPANPMAKLDLAAEQTKGIGPSLTNRIKSMYGDEWEGCLHVGTVPGLSQKLWDALQDTLRRMAQSGAASEAIAWLMGLGCTINMAQKAWALWEMDTMGKVNANCYVLAGLPNYGFCHIDKAIRRNFGIEDNDPRRIRAALEYSIKQLTAGGSDCAEWSEIVGRAISETGGVTRDLIIQYSESMFEAGTLVVVPETSLVALGVDYKNSEEIASWID